MKDQPNTPKKMSPWGALGALALMALIVLGFIWGVVALIKWA
jgi:hypothetical protein